MGDFTGKTVVISGGAEGIGFSIAKALGQQGMCLVLGDIDGEQLALAKADLEERGIQTLTVEMDVTKPSDWERLAQESLARFSKIHMLVNNAGVGGGTGPLERLDDQSWQWVTDVNLTGVMYGARYLVPLLKAHGEGGHLLNVASMAGMLGVPYAGAYTATKSAVVALSESWHQELAHHGIHVSVLCPAFVKTRIHLADRNRQSAYQSQERQRTLSERDRTAAAHMQQVIENGLAVDIVGERVVEALRSGELYIFTHPNYRQVVQARYKAIDAAFERAAASPLLAHIRDEPVVGFG